MFGNLFETAPTFDDPLGMLKACNRRIERALGVLERLTELEQQGPLDQAALLSLRQLLYYFAVGVPRHSADEEESLFPRLRVSTQVTERADALMDQLATDHADLDAAHQKLNLLGEELLHSGRFETDEQRMEFQRLARFLSETYSRHIRAEDQELFPFAEAAVKADEMEGVSCEMAARRGLDWNQQREIVAGFRSRHWQKV